MAADRPVALISGTSRGIGNHLARHFLSREYAVIGCSRSQPDGLDDPNYAHHTVDVGSEPQVVELFRRVRRDYGHLEVAIGNAASHSSLSLATLTSAVAAEDVLRTNVLGVFLWCREAIKLMMRRGYGRIVNLGSVATRHEVPGEALYTASKAAINAMTRVLAKETAADGITCNVVAPAAVETDSMAALGREHVEELLGRNAIHRMGSMEEISATVDWLISAAGAAITGQVIYLGGA